MAFLVFQGGLDRTITHLSIPIRYCGYLLLNKSFLRFLSIYFSINTFSIDVTIKLLLVDPVQMFEVYSPV